MITLGSIALLIRDVLGNVITHSAVTGHYTIGATIVKNMGLMKSAQTRFTILKIVLPKYTFRLDLRGIELIKKNNSFQAL